MRGLTILPILVSIVILMSSGIIGSWFIVEENVFYFAYDDSLSLDGQSTNNHYLDHYSISNMSGESQVLYTDTGCNSAYGSCDKRADVFFNISAILYSILFLLVVASILVYIMEEDLFPNLRKIDLLKYSFGIYVFIIILIIILSLYSVFSIPSALHSDHSGGGKECLYTNQINVIGKVDCLAQTNNGQTELHSSWFIGPAAVLFILGTISPSIFLSSTLFDQLRKSSTTSRSISAQSEIVTKQNLFFDFQMFNYIIIVYVLSCAVITSSSQSINHSNRKHNYTIIV